MGDEPDLALIVNGTRHEGWKQITVRTSIEELCGSFTVKFAERWAQDKKPVPIREGDACEIKLIGGLARLNKTVLTGYVDDFSASYDAGSHELSVSGRSKTCDLIDCAAIYKSGQIKGKTLKQIAELLCEPFGIDVVLGDPLLAFDARFTAPVGNLRIQIGETVFEILSRLAKKCGVLLFTTPEGELSFTRASSVPLPSLELRRGENIERGSFTASQRERFEEYHFKGQTSATDNWSGESAAQIGNSVTDSQVKRYRPTVILAEHQGTREDLGRRAVWERNTRAGRSERLNYTVMGLTNIFGLWAPNTLLRVADDWFRIDDDMLVTGVELSQGTGEARAASLELTGREAFDVLDPPPARKKRG